MKVLLWAAVFFILAVQTGAVFPDDKNTVKLEKADYIDVVIGDYGRHFIQQDKGNKKIAINKNGLRLLVSASGDKTLYSYFVFFSDDKRFDCDFIVIFKDFKQAFNGYFNNSDFQDGRISPETVLAESGKTLKESVLVYSVSKDVQLSVSPGFFYTNIQVEGDSQQDSKKVRVLAISTRQGKKYFIGGDGVEWYLYRIYE